MYVRIRSMYVSMCVCVYVCMYDPCYFPEYPHSALQTVRKQSSMRGTQSNIVL